jgi:autotransporter-associated beta strand protein
MKNKYVTTIFLNYLFSFIFILNSATVCSQFLFSDNAVNYNGSWGNLSNQGNGFLEWNIQSNGTSAGNFIGNPSSDGMGTDGIGSSAFAFYAHSGKYVNAIRYFGNSNESVGMMVGDTFSFYWSMNWDAGVGNKGFDFRQGETVVFNVNNSNSSNIFTTNGMADANYGVAPMLVIVTRTSSTTYNFSMTSRSGGATFSTVINSSLNIDNVKFYADSQQDSNGNRNMYFNNFTFSKTNNYLVNEDTVEPRVLEGSSGINKQGSGILTLTAQNTFTGLITVDSGVLQLNATGGNTIPSTNDIIVNSGSILKLSSNQELANLTINPGGVAIVESGVSLKVTGTLNNEGQIIFKSDATGTGVFDQFTGTITGSGTAITERYLPSKRGWRLLTAPLKGATNATIPANWQGVNDEGLLFFSPSTYQSQMMTGYTTGGGMPNIWKYDSATTQWQSIPNLTTENLFTSTGNNGFLVFATGPSNSTNIVSGATETTLRPEGQLITGDVSHSLTTDKYHLIGNPYASPLHTEAMVQANANTKVFMVDPTIGTVGGYVTYDGSNWTPTPPSGSEKHIQSGQGFFVRSASNTTFTISESHKVIGNSNTWFERLGASASSSSNSSTSSSVMEDKLRVLLYKQVDSQWQLADGILTVNSATGNNDVDATDTGKMTNFNENIAFRNGTSNLSIEYRGLPTIGTIQPMRLTGTTVQPYQMRVRTENYSHSDLQPYLEDTQTGVLTLIPIDGSEVVVNFTGIAATTTAPDSRFRIVYPVTLSSDDPTASLSVGIYPNPVEDKIFTIVLANQDETTQYTLTNLLGQQVQQGKLDTLQNTVSVASLQGGVYVLQVVQSGKTFTTKLIIK